MRGLSSPCPSYFVLAHIRGCVGLVGVDVMMCSKWKNLRVHVEGANEEKLKIASFTLKGIAQNVSVKHLNNLVKCFIPIRGNKMVSFDLSLFSF